MSDQWKSTCRFVTLRSPSPPTDLSPGPTPAFRFNDLPGEVRNKIYRLCLINESPIALDVLELFLSDVKVLEGAQIPRKESLVCFLRDPEIEKWTVNAKLLRVNKAIRDEAASIFYGCNKFQFLRQQSLIHFPYFEWNLTDVAYQHLRYLEVGFPSIERTVVDNDIVSQFSKVGDRGLWVLGGLPRLEDVTFHPRDDVMTSDIGLLRRIRRSCRGCKVLLSLGDMEVYDQRRPYSRRAVKISSAALEAMCNWGWEVKGQYMEINRKHAWRDEHQWLEALQEILAQNSLLQAGWVVNMILSAPKGYETYDASHLLDPANEVVEESFPTPVPMHLFRYGQTQSVARMHYDLDKE